MKYKYIVLFLFLSAINLFSQTKEDSLIYERKQLLLKEIRSNKIPTNAGDEINEIIKHYKFTNIKQGFAFIDTLLSQKIILTNDTLSSSIFSLLAGIYINLGQVDYAARNLFRAYNITMNFKDSPSNGWTLLEIGNLYYSIGKFEKSKEYYTNSFNEFIKMSKVNTQERDNIYLGIAVSLENLALSLVEIDKFDEAIQKVKEAYNYREKLKNSMYLQYANMNIAKIFLEMNNSDSALFYYRKSLDYSQKEVRYEDKSQQFIFKIQSLTGIFRAFYKHNLIDSMNYYENYINDLVKNTGNLQHYVITYASNSYFFHENKDYHNSLKYGQIALHIAEKYKYDFLYNDIYHILYKSYEKINKRDSALKYLQLTNKLFDENKEKFVLQSIELSESNEKLDRNLYEMERMKNEKERISNENRINNARMKNQRYILIAVIVFLSLIGIGIYNRFHYKTKMVKEIGKKNDELHDAIDKLHAYQIELNNSNKELQDSNETKNTLFSIIAHDLKNSIGSVRDAINLLNSEYNSLSDDEKIEFLDLSKKSSDNLYNLLENLLIWSSAQRQALKLNLVSTNLKLLASKSIQLYQSKAKDKNITIINNFDDELTLNIDPNQIDTVIRNILNNAVKFTKKNGEIKLFNYQQDNEELLVIEDNGIGMPKEKADNLFKGITNNSTYGTDGEKGTGLGLLVCKEFIVMHGGKIWAESEEGKGTKVFFTLPR